MLPADARRQVQSMTEGRAAAPSGQPLTLVGARYRMNADCKHSQTEDGQRDQTQAQALSATRELTCVATAQEVTMTRYWNRVAQACWLGVKVRG